MNIFHSIASEQLHRYISDTHGGKSSVAFGLPFSARACVLARMERFILWVVPDFVTAERAAEALSVFTAKPVATVSQREEVLLFKRVLSGESVYRETASLWQIAEGKVGSAVVTVDALIKLFPKKQELLNATIRLRLGDDYDLSTLSKALVRAGYRRENNVQAKGQFALRGDILDVFPVQEELPFRAEFFGDTLESLKQFAPETQKSGERLSEAVVVPATDIFVAEEELPQIEKTMRNQLASLNVAPTAKAKLSIALEDLLTRLKDGSREHSLSAVLPYLSSTATLCDYLPENAVVAFDEPKRILDTCRLLYDEHDARFNQLFLAGEVLKGQHAQLQPRDAVFAPFQAFCNTSFSMITSQTTVLPPQAVYSLKASPAPRYNASFIELAEDLKNWRHTGYRVVLCAGSQDSAAMIGGELSRNGVFHAKQCESALHEGEELAILPVFLTNGFVLHEQRLAVIGTTDMLRTRKKKVVGRRRADVFITPEVGDYVVHEVHGVGICRGIARLQLPHEKEYLSIEYANGDMLYLPCDQLDSLAKYAGAEKAPKLNRIGGKDFSKLKERVKKALREMAIDLQALYAARRSAVGFAFPPDDELMAEFEARFPYQETVDQLSAIAEIKSDMQSAHVMDRLLCGDVGFGKTEVALRAAFKAVEAGKQVAILSPTTILSEQHFH
ncbi:MAG: hypothetical protein IJF71_06995, partial [Clostridia bacterium]|nr:hypothetical protein [Clostridia bacterium]